MEHVCIPVCVSVCVCVPLCVCTLGKGTLTEANHVCQGRGMLNTPHPTAAHLPSHSLPHLPQPRPFLHCLSALLSVSRKWQTLFCQRLLIISAVIVVVVVAVAVC